MENKVNVPKGDYELMAPKWRKMRDVIEGEDKLKNRTGGKYQGCDYPGTCYLPPLDGQDPVDYQKYVDRAIYYNAVGRTVQGYQGMIYRKEPIIDYAENGPEYEFKTQDGKNLEDVLRELTIEVISVNRVGVLIDVPQQSTEGMTVQEVEEQNLNPYWVIYKTENIINWRTENINNAKKLSLVVLREWYSVPDGFVEKTTEQYRVLQLVDGVYQQSLYRADKNGKYVLYEEPYLVYKNGEPLKDIPFYIITEKGLEYDELLKPILLDMANVNLGHFRNSADYEQMLHWTGVKTVVGPGMAGPENQIIVGKYIATASPDMKPYVLESSSDSALENEMRNKEDRMVALGAEQVVSPKFGASKTATETLVNNTSKNSTVANIANSISRIATMMFRFTVEWLPVDSGTKANIINNIEDYRIELNTDFFAKEMTGADILALIKAWQDGAIDIKTLRWNLRKGERIPNAYSDEQIEEGIVANPVNNSGLDPIM